MSTVFENMKEWKASCHYTLYVAVKVQHSPLWQQCRREGKVYTWQHYRCSSPLTFRKKNNQARFLFYLLFILLFFYFFLFGLWLMTQHISDGRPPPTLHKWKSRLGRVPAHVVSFIFAAEETANEGSNDKVRRKRKSKSIKPTKQVK